RVWSSWAWITLRAGPARRSRKTSPSRRGTSSSDACGRKRLTAGATRRCSLVCRPPHAWSNEARIQVTWVARCASPLTRRGSRSCRSWMRDATRDAPEDAPGWRLMETRPPSDQLTGRDVGGLHEDILMLDPSGRDGSDLFEP